MTELMCAVYPDSHPTHPNGFLIAFRDRETGKFLHIIEDKFPASVIATGIDMPRSEHWNETETLKFTYLSEPQSPTIRRLFQGTEVKVPGTSESNWWDVFLRMEYRETPSKSNERAAEKKAAANQPPVPGSPHPPAPDGAEFVAEKTYRHSRRRESACRSVLHSSRQARTASRHR